MLKVFCSRLGSWFVFLVQFFMMFALLYGLLSTGASDVLAAVAVCPRFHTIPEPLIPSQIENCPDEDGILYAMTRCDCVPKHNPMFCYTYMCYNIPAQTLNVCSSHGTCVAPNNCKCDPGYDGENCEKIVEGQSSASVHMTKSEYVAYLSRISLYLNASGWPLISLFAFLVFVSRCIRECFVRCGIATSTRNIRQSVDRAIGSYGGTKSIIALWGAFLLAVQYGVASMFSKLGAVYVNYCFELIITYIVLVGIGVVVQIIITVLAGFMFLAASFNEEPVHKIPKCCCS